MKTTIKKLIKTCTLSIVASSFGCFGYAKSVNVIVEMAVNKNTAASFAFNSDEEDTPEKRAKAFIKSSDLSKATKFTMNENCDPVAVPPQRGLGAMSLGDDEEGHVVFGTLDVDDHDSESEAMEKLRHGTEGVIGVWVDAPIEHFASSGTCEEDGQCDVEETASSENLEKGFYNKEESDLLSKFHNLYEKMHNEGTLTTEEFEKLLQLHERGSKADNENDVCQRLPRRRARQPIVGGSRQPIGGGSMPVADMPCPFNSCDCDARTPKGTIYDVARYLGVPKFWDQHIFGSGVVVGVVDGGIDTRVPGKTPSIKLAEKVIGGYPHDWGKKDAWNGHGMMSATDVVGMAPGAKIYDLRISESSGGATSAAIKAYSWALQQHQKDGTPHILTNSWGIYARSWDPDYAINPNHPFTRLVKQAIDRGIIVLFAAGNCGNVCSGNSQKCEGDRGQGRDIWGANGLDIVVSVGAVNIKEEYVGYSSMGPAALSSHKPDFVSPTHFTGHLNSDNGTSAACPIAAGVVALLVEKGGFKLKQQEVLHMMQSTAKQIDDRYIDENGWSPFTGYGVLRADKLAALEVGTPRKPDVPRKPDDVKDPEGDDKDNKKPKKNKHWSKKAPEALVNVVAIGNSKLIGISENNDVYMSDTSTGTWKRYNKEFKKPLERIINENDNVFLFDHNDQYHVLEMDNDMWVN